MDCALPDHPIVGLLARELGVDTDKALACYARTLFGFGDHRIDGRPEFVADVTLEEWARWKGKVGRWAAAFRRLCVEHRADQKDEQGVIKGWWRQRALLEKQLKDAAKRKPTRREAGAVPPGTTQLPPGNPRGFSSEFTGHDDDDDDGYGKEASASSGAGARETGPVDPVSRVEYAQRCTVACNRGLRENELIQGFNELVASNQVDTAGEWYEARIPVEVAEQAIYQRARAYPPAGRNRQPRSLNYFRDVVKEAAEREAGRDQERRFTPRAAPAPEREEEDEFVRAGRKIDEERARASGGVKASA
jgi:hypothetical protein